MDELINRYVDDLRALPNIQKELDLIKSNLIYPRKIVGLFEKLGSEEKIEVFLNTYSDNENEIRKKADALQKRIEMIKTDSVGFIGKLRSEANENKKDAEKLQTLIASFVESANGISKVLKQLLDKKVATTSIPELKSDLEQCEKHEQDLQEQLSDDESVLSSLGFLSFRKKRTLLESIEKTKAKISQASAELCDMKKLFDLKNDIEKTNDQFVHLLESANSISMNLQQSLNKDIGSISIQDITPELAQLKTNGQDLKDQISAVKSELNSLGFFAASKKRALLKLAEKISASISKTSIELCNMQIILDLKNNIEEMSAQAKAKKDYSEKINKLLCNINLFRELAKDPLVLSELTKDMEIVKLMVADPETLQEIVKSPETLQLLTKKHIISLKEQVRNGAKIIFFGNYPQNKETVKEPIAWRVLDEKDGKVLLISDLVLYNKGTSRDTFINAAFTQNEQIYIEKTIHTFEHRTNSVYEYDGSYVDDESHWFNYYYCDKVASNRWSTSTDETKVFSLNMQELLKYFPTKKDRIAYSARILADKRSNLKYKKEWALSFTVIEDNLPDGGRVYACYVDREGMIVEGYEFGLGIRPAMWVNINY